MQQGDVLSPVVLLASEFDLGLLQVKKLLNAAYERARGILTINRDELEALASELLEKESLTGVQVKPILCRLCWTVPVFCSGPCSCAAVTAPPLASCWLAPINTDSVGLGA